MIRKEMIAMLLAGGQDRRLGVLSEKSGGAAVPFGGKYRIIDFPLSNCINSGVDTVGVLCRQQDTRLRTHIGIGIPWDMDRSEGGITLLPPCLQAGEDGWYQGPVDALARNMEFIENCHPDHVLILPADQIYKMDYEVMLDFHKASGADVTLAVMPVPAEGAGRFDIVTAERDGKILALEDRPGQPGSSFASTGICIFSLKILLESLQAFSGTADSSFFRHVLPWCMERGASLAAYEFSGFWEDAVTLGAYWEANMELVDIIPELNLYEEFWRVFTKNDVIPPQYISPDSYICRSLIGDGTEVYGNVENSVIGQNVRICEGAVVRDSIVMDNAVIGRGALLDKAIAGENVWIGDNAVVGTGELVPNAREPDVYAYGLAVVGEDSVIPAGVKIGRNTVVDGRTVPEDYPGGMLPGGETLRKGPEQ